MRPLIYALIFLLSLSYSSALAASEDRQKNLIDLKVFNSGDKEKIKLRFDKTFDEIPSTYLEKGVLRLSLDNTNFPETLKFTRVNNGFINNLRLFKNKNGSLLEIAFAQSNLDAQGRVSISQKNQELFLIINRKATADDQASKLGDLLGLGIKKSEDAEQQETETKQSTSNTFFDEYWGVLIQMLASLTLILILIAISLWIFKKFLAKRFRNPLGKHNVKVVSVQPVTPKHKVMVMEVNDEAFACAVSSNNINLISRVASGENRKAVISSRHPEEYDFNAIRAEYQKNLEKEEELSSPPPKKENKALPRFGKELLKRVKEMRQID